MATEDSGKAVINQESSSSIANDGNHVVKQVSKCFNTNSSDQEDVMSDHESTDSDSSSYEEEDAVKSPDGYCEICKEVLAIYRCPRCEIRTCSLKCVKKHKAERECNGKRDKTKYVAVKEMTDYTLINGEFNFEL